MTQFSIVYHHHHRRRRRRRRLRRRRRRHPPPPPPHHHHHHPHPHHHHHCLIPNSKNQIAIIFLFLPRYPQGAPFASEWPRTTGHQADRSMGADFPRGVGVGFWLAGFPQITGDIFLGGGIRSCLPTLGALC